MRRERLLLAVFGLGHLRPAPGTWGSVPAVLAAFGLAALGWPGWMTDTSIALIGLAFAVACVRFGHHAEAMYGRKDPPDVVADEMAGQSIPLLFLPWHAPGESWMFWNATLALVAFASFRVFDISKPWPIRRLERFPGGWGILIDDLLAGVYAAVVTQVVVRVVL